MKQSQIIDMAQSRAGISSDNKLSLALGCNRSAISHWRSERRHIDDVFALKLAGLAGMEPGEVLAIVAASQAKTPDVATAWLALAKMAKKAQNGAVNMTAFAAVASPLALAAKGSQLFSTAAYCILCSMTNQSGSTVSQKRLRQPVSFH
jgi:hypothetical protein